MKWAEDGIDNVAWLLALGDALGDEFMYRRGKLHASSLVLNELQRRFAPMLVNIQPPTHFVLAMPKHIQEGALVASPEKAVERYRAYYNECKQGFWRRTVGARDVEQARSARVVCASARTKQAARGLA